MRNKLALTAIALWVVSVAAFGYMFIRGITASSPDGRVAIVLTQTERDHVLSEMRGMLEAVEAIVQAVAREDHAAIAKAAKPVGSSASRSEPLVLLAKLPLEFKRDGMAMHANFDRIEAAANEGKPLREITTLLGKHLTLCTTCHAGYRFAY